jgi:hypothetical protein
VIVYSSVRIIHFKADKRRLQDQVYEHFQDEVHEDFKIKYMRTPIFSFQSNEASVLEYIAPIYFYIYSVVVVLHACVNEWTPMLGLTVTEVMTHNISYRIRLQMKCSKS